MKRICRKTTLYLQGTHVYVERWESKRQVLNQPTLVCIHGFLSSSYSFHKLIPHFSPSLDIICLDLPGFGLSSKPKTFRYELKNYAALVAELIKIYNLKGVTLIGHSMGGQIALRTAHDYPELVESLILLAPSVYFHRVRKEVYYASFLPFLAGIFHKWGRKQDCRSFIEQLMYSKRSISQSMVESYGRPFKELSFYEALICLIRQREGDMEEQDLKNVQQKTLIMWGNEDPLIPVSTAYKLKRDLAHSTLAVLSHTGHLIPEEQPTLTAKYAKRFLS
ncbi:alpha/beta fold hydrolase [Alkalicoccobacillus porphyridii]|uniref:alpha/beta fold hydrolase n=1 Tax=Alkalicoccobacillus porphyridii TaxID=2597270 RepID=UPI00163DB433|nr:alpha/beta hydrolase [Alkalicoccobacillus porphyridii]